MSSNRPSRESGSEPENVLSLLRQLDAEIQQRRQEDEARLAQLRGSDSTATPGEGEGEAGGLPPAMLAEILGRLDRLDAQLRQMQTMVQLEHLETQLRQMQQLVQHGMPSGANLEELGPASSEGGARSRPPTPGVEVGGRPPVEAGAESARRDPRLVRLPSTFLTEAETVETGRLRGEASATDVAAPFGGPAPDATDAGRWAFVRPEVDDTLAPPLDDLDDEPEGGSPRRRLILIGVAVTIIALLVGAVLLVPRLMRPATGPTAVGKAPVIPGRVVFQSDRDTPGQAQLFMVGADGANLTRLPIAIPYALNPRFSPDGTRIAFYGTVGGIDDIYLVDADGSNLRRVTRQAGNNRHPTWSPDGQWLAFGSDRSGNWDVYISRIDGSDVRNLTNAPSDDNLPSWSPDGTKLAFQSDRSGRMQIYTVEINGGTPLNISRSNGNDQYPQWSPDGSLLAFYSNREGNNEVYVMKADGNDQRNLTTHPAKDEVAVWSPDGRWLIFASERDGNMELYELRLETGEVRRLTDNTNHDWAPSWGR
jgi:Tol biopolymer transport system component